MFQAHSFSRSNCTQPPLPGQLAAWPARIPRASQGRAGLLPKEVGLSGPPWGKHCSTPSVGLLPAPGPFPLSLGKRETISSFHGGSVAGRLMNVSPAQRPACQKCPQCIQRSPRWAAGRTKDTELRSRVPSSGRGSNLTGIPLWK